MCSSNAYLRSVNARMNDCSRCAPFYDDLSDDKPRILKTDITHAASNDNSRSKRYVGTLDALVFRILISVPVQQKAF